jgi:hypothetical protein
MISSYYETISAASKQSPRLSQTAHGKTAAVYGAALPRYRLSQHFRSSSRERAAV